MADNAKAPWYLILLENVLSIPSLLFAGYVLARYWGWFVVDSGRNHGIAIPEISYGESVGLILLVGLIHGTQVTMADGAKAAQAQKDQTPLEKVLLNLAFLGMKIGFLYPMCLLVGYLWHKALY